MRTDSTQVARQAITEARDFIGRKYGEDYVPPHARTFTRRVRGAQEAHEAIRPTRIVREPSQVKAYLTPSQFRLYDLIWKRMVASQMAPAIFDNTSVDVRAQSRESRTDYAFRATCSVNRFPGYTVLYAAQSDDEEATVKSSPLTTLKKGDPLDLLGLFPEQHFTQPPPRYNEASLIRTLEQYGIGRPSTYAPTLSTIQAREYVTKERGSLHPTELVWSSMTWSASTSRTSRTSSSPHEWRKVWTASPTTRATGCHWYRASTRHSRNVWMPPPRLSVSSWRTS
jgi:DNA topoisomerase-1